MLRDRFREVTLLSFPLIYARKARIDLHCLVPMKRPLSEQARTRGTALVFPISSGGRLTNSGASQVSESKTKLDLAAGVVGALGYGAPRGKGKRSTHRSERTILPASRTLALARSQTKALVVPDADASDDRPPSRSSATSPSAQRAGLPLEPRPSYFLFPPLAPAASLEKQQDFSFRLANMMDESGESC